MILILILAGLVIAGLIYWRWLEETYTEPGRADEMHSVVTSDGWKIQLYRFRPKNEGAEPVLLCHGGVSNHVSLSTPAGKSLTDALVAAGYDCWLIDLRGCRSSVAPAGAWRTEVTFDDYLLRDIPAALALIREKTGCERVHWVGHSLGGMLLYAYDQVFGADQLASGATLGSPVNLDSCGPECPGWALKLLRGGSGAIFTVIRALTPLSLAVKPRSQYLPLNWDNLHPDVTPRMFFNMIETLPAPVAEKLAEWARRKQWLVRNDEVDVTKGLKGLAVPLLAVYGQDDKLAPPGQAEEFFKGIKQKDKQMLVLSKANGCSADYGHIDLVFARSGATEVFGPIVQWLKAHPVAPRRARKPAAAKKAAAGKPAARKKTAAKKRTVE